MENPNIPELFFNTEGVLLYHIAMKKGWADQSTATNRMGDKTTVNQKLPNCTMPKCQTKSKTQNKFKNLDGGGGGSVSAQEPSTTAEFANTNNAGPKVYLLRYGVQMD